MKSFILFLGLSICSLDLFAAKAMDCRECRESYGENSPCEPICGGQSQTGKKPKFLYNQMKPLTAPDCGEGYCNTTFEEVTCSWSNEKKRKKFECTYTDERGKSGKIQGAGAQKLSDAITGLGKIKPACEKARCGFDNPQSVTCTQLKSGAGKTASFTYECKVLVSLKIGLESKEEVEAGETDGPPASDKKPGTK